MAKSHVPAETPAHESLYFARFHCKTSASLLFETMRTQDRCLVVLQQQCWPTLCVHDDIGEVDVWQVELRHNGCGGPAF